jgi:hypothetical protein
MELTPQQEQAVRGWAQEGLGLAEIQKRLASEFGVSATYMDVRFLVLDLGVDIKEKPKRETANAGADLSAGGGLDVEDDPAGPAADVPGPGEALGGGAVSVELDRVTKPGAVVSGRVTFSDGVSAGWFLDQLGRLGIEATTPGYKPSPGDVAAFQQELKNQLSARGF